MSRLCRRSRKAGCKALSYDTLISVRRSEHNKVFCTDQECRRGLSSARPLLSRSISSLALVSTPALTLRFSSWLSTHVVADFPEVCVTRLPILIYIRLFYSDTAKRKHPSTSQGPRDEDVRSRAHEDALSRSALCIIDTLVNSLLQAQVFPSLSNFVKQGNRALTVLIATVEGCSEYMASVIA